jgi:hypothetical protein
MRVIEILPASTLVFCDALLDWQFPRVAVFLIVSGTAKLSAPTAGLSSKKETQTNW